MRASKVSKVESELEVPFVPRFASHNDFKRAMEEITDDPLQDTGHNIVVYRGTPKGRIMLVGEAPGQDENTQLKPFVGISGQLLEKILVEAGFDTENECYFSNVVRRRPPGNRQPTEEEITYFYPWLVEEMRLVDPLIILAIGATAMKVIFGLEKSAAIGKFRGDWYSPPVGPDIPEGAWCMTWYHPSYLLRIRDPSPDKPRALTWGDAKEVRRKYLELIATSNTAPGSDDNLPKEHWDVPF